MMKKILFTTAIAMTAIMEGLEGMEQLKERIPGLTVIRLQNKIWNSR